MDYIIKKIFYKRGGFDADKKQQKWGGLKGQ